MPTTLVAKVSAEFFGTLALVLAVVGSGFMAESLTSDGGVKLLINASVTVLVLIIIISSFINISGSHFNPVVTLMQLGREKISLPEALAYLAAQMTGAITGSVIANYLFNSTIFEISHHDRSSANNFASEVIATLGLLIIVLNSGEKCVYLVPAWIGAAYFFTPSTSFANPAATIGRLFTDSYAGIAPQSAVLFGAAQCTALALLFAFLVLTGKSTSHE